MISLCRVEEIRAAERAAMNAGRSEADLMRAAGRGVAREIERLFAGPRIEPRGDCVEVQDGAVKCHLFLVESPPIHARKPELKVIQITSYHILCE